MRRGVFAMLACAALVTGCDNSGGSAAILPTAPAPQTTETFTGTVDPLGSAFNTFTVAQTGEVDVTLTAAGPPSTIFMGLGVGSPNTADGTCTLNLGSGSVVNTQASATPQIVGTASAGPLCVKVFDVGNQTGTINYTVTVAHS